MIQEAYAARVPVVASRIGALVRKVGVGEDALLFTPGDSDVLRSVLEVLAADYAKIRSFQEALPTATTIAGHVDALSEVYSACCE